MRHLGYRGVGLVDGVRDRVAEEPRDELVDAVVQGRRKQQALATIRRRGQDPRDAGQKTEIGHVIRLVDHGDLDRVEADQTLLHQVLEPAGAGDDDVDAGFERGHLAGLRDAAEDRGDPQATRSRQRLERRGDLRRELAGGCEHQPRGPCGAPVSVGEAADEWNRECEGLSAAGFPAAEDISAGECVGQGFHLNREWVCYAARCERTDDVFAHAEIGESLVGSHFSVPFRHRWCRAGDKEVTRASARRWRDCRVAKSIAARPASARCTVIEVSSAIFFAGTSGMRKRSTTVLACSVVKPTLPPA